MSNHGQNSFSGYLNGKPLDLSNLHTVPPPPQHHSGPVKRKQVHRVPVGGGLSRGPKTSPGMPGSPHLSSPSEVVHKADTLSMAPVAAPAPTAVYNEAHKSSTSSLNKASSSHSNYSLPYSGGSPRTPVSTSTNSYFQHETGSPPLHLSPGVVNPASTSVISVDRGSSTSTNEFYDSRDTPSPGSPAYRSDRDSNDNTKNPSSPGVLYYSHSNGESNAVPPTRPYSDSERITADSRSFSSVDAPTSLSQNADKVGQLEPNPSIDSLPEFDEPNREAALKEFYLDTNTQPISTTRAGDNSGFQPQADYSKNQDTAAVNTATMAAIANSTNSNQQGYYSQQSRVPPPPTWHVSSSTVPLGPPVSLLSHGHNEVRQNFRQDLRADIRNEIRTERTSNVARHSKPAPLRMPSPFAQQYPPALPLSTPSSVSEGLGMSPSPYGTSKFSYSSSHVQNEELQLGHRKSGSVNSSSSGLSSNQQLYMNPSGPQNAALLKQQQKLANGAYLAPSSSNTSTADNKSIHTRKESDIVITNPADFGIGVGSVYVKELRKKDAIVWSDVPSRVWGLPIGIAGKSSSASSTSMVSPFSPSRIYLKRAMDIKHSHLTPRLLAIEVDEQDNDDEATLGSSIKNSSSSDFRTLDNNTSKVTSVKERARMDNSSIAGNDPTSSSSTGGNNRLRAISVSSIKSVEEGVDKIRLFVANPDEDDD